MERLDDPVLVVAGQDEAAVLGELLHEVAEGGLSGVLVEIICFIKHDVLAAAL